MASLTPYARARYTQAPHVRRFARSPEPHDRGFGSTSCAQSAVPARSSLRAPAPVGLCGRRTRDDRTSAHRAPHRGVPRLCARGADAETDAQDFGASSARRTRPCGAGRANAAAAPDTNGRRPSEALTAGAVDAVLTSCSTRSMSNTVASNGGGRTPSLRRERDSSAYRCLSERVTDGRSAPTRRARRSVSRAGARDLTVAVVYEGFAGNRRGQPRTAETPRTSS